MENLNRVNRYAGKPSMCHQALVLMEQASVLLAGFCILFGIMYLVDPARYEWMLNLVAVLGAGMNGCLAVRAGLMKKLLLTLILGAVSVVTGIAAVCIFCA